MSGYRNPRIMAGILVENRGYALQEWMLQSLLSGVQPWNSERLVLSIGVAALAWSLVPALARGGLTRRWRCGGESTDSEFR